jgi:hypothetical protein
MRESYGKDCNSALGGAIGGYAAMGSLKTQACDTRMAEIPHEIECIERTLKGCYQGLDTLNERLSSSVARCEPPSAVENKTASPQAVPQTATGRALQSLAAQVAEINARIQSLIARLEV